jgi:hypothetical protein
MQSGRVLLRDAAPSPSVIDGSKPRDANACDARRDSGC